MLKNLIKFFLPFYSIHHFFKNYLLQIKYHWLIKSKHINFYKDTQQQILYKELISLEFSKILFANKNIPFELICNGGTIDYKMVYLLSRIIKEIKSIHNIIEFGVGISTILFLKLCNYNNMKIISVDHSQHWIMEISEEINNPNHNFILTRLKEYNYGKMKYTWYDYDTLEPAYKNKFNLILVDGPFSSNNYSRFGINVIIEQICSTDYIIIWDDLHRFGELQSFVQMIDILRKMNFDPEHILFDGIKKIGLIYSKNYMFLKHYF